MTSERRHVLQILVKKIRLRGNRQEYSFKASPNWFSSKLLCDKSMEWFGGLFRNSPGDSDFPALKWGGNVYVRENVEEKIY